MKTEERHELKKNELNEVLTQLEPYWRAIVGGIVVVLGGLVALGMISSNQRKASETGWQNYFAASANRDPDTLMNLGEAQGSKPVGPWAFYTSAQGKLVEASTQVARDRGLAKTNFEEAAAGFQKAIDRAGTYRLLKQQAQWGLAIAQEGLNDLDKAKLQYEQIVSDWPESEMAKRAQARLDVLGDPGTKSFYDWYFAQTPPAASTGAGGSGTTLPFGDVSDEPDFSVPDLGGGGPSTDDLSVDDPAEGDADADSADADSADTEDTAAETTDADNAVSDDDAE